MSWKDISSYSRGQTDRTPTEWELRDRAIRVQVHRHHWLPGHWLLSCEPFFNLFALKSTDIEDAKAEAIGIVANRLMETLEQLTKEKDGD